MGIDEGSSGTVTVDAAFSFEVVQSAPGAADGVLIIGIPAMARWISDTPAFFSAIARSWDRTRGSTGNLSLSNSIWAAVT